QGNLFIGGVRYGEIAPSGQLQRIVMNENLEELRRESLLQDRRWRIRDVRQGPDGLLYVITDERNGALIRIEPIELPAAFSSSLRRPSRSRAAAVVAFRGSRSGTFALGATRGSACLGLLPPNQCSAAGAPKQFFPARVQEEQLEVAAHAGVVAIHCQV